MEINTPRRFKKIFRRKKAFDVTWARFNKRISADRTRYALCSQPSTSGRFFAEYVSIVIIVNFKDCQLTYLTEDMSVYYIFLASFHLILKFLQKLSSPCNKYKTSQWSLTHPMKTGKFLYLKHENCNYFLQFFLQFFFFAN